MNLEFANRLIALRKGCGLSQEELAQRIGVSRQAVSKWERGEASPDTYNLVELSKVFNVTLDELVTGCKDADDTPKTSSIEGKGITIDDRGIYFTKDGQTKNVISFVHADDSDEDKTVKSEHCDCGRDDDDIDDDDDDDDEGERIYKSRVYDKTFRVDDEDEADAGKPEKRTGYTKSRSFLMDFPFTILIVIAYLVCGFVFKLWHPTWLLFLLIPLFEPFVKLACDIKNPSRWMRFPYPVLACGVYLLIGFVWNAWHPYWIILLSIPVYYLIASAFARSEGFMAYAIFPVCVTMAYAVLGFTLKLWHPAWLLFLTIPLYSSLVYIIRNRHGSNAYLAFPYPVLCVLVFLSLGIIWNIWGLSWLVFLSIPFYYTIGGALAKHRKIRGIYSLICVTAYLIMGFGFRLWHPGWIVFLTIPVVEYIANGIKK